MSKEILTFKSVQVDAQTIGSSVELPLSFFCDGHSFPNERITRLEEQRAVRWLLDQESCRRLFLGELGVASCNYRDSIPDSVFDQIRHRQGGDVDFVALESESPTHAACVEFKRVKVRVHADGKETVNGLEELEKLIRQGNQRQSMGFWKTFICAIAVVDNHLLETPNTLLRRGDPRDYQRVYHLGQHTAIHEDVGILLIEVAQPSGKDFGSRFGFGICKLKEAKVLEQPPNLTECLKTYFRQSSEGTV